jgi:TonB-dependent starch-binding outer membrane protein SusC
LYRLGLRNDFSFLKNFTASIFVRADLGQIGAYRAALNEGWVQNDCQSRNNGPVPYWTSDKPNNEYARLNTSIAGFGGGLMIYKPRSFVRVQDVSLTYNLPRAIAQRIKVENMQIFGSIRNLATFTKWPGWDPESGMDPMPRTYTFGLNFSL